jgi:hypothetical protein
MIEDAGDLQDLKRLLDPAFLRKAEVSALKGVRGKLSTRVSRSVRDTYNVTASLVSRKLNVGLRNNNTEAWLSWVGKRIGLINFSANFRNVKSSRGSRRGVTVKVQKDKSRFLVKGGFIATGAGGNAHIFKRMGSGRLPLKSLKGPSIPQMVNSPKVMADAERLVESEYPTILRSKLDFFLKKEFGR